MDTTWNKSPVYVFWTFSTYSLSLADVFCFLNSFMASKTSWSLSLRTLNRFISSMESLRPGLTKRVVKWCWMCNEIDGGTVFCSVLKSGYQTGKKTGTGLNWTDGNQFFGCLYRPVTTGSSCGCGLFMILCGPNKNRSRPVAIGFRGQFAL